MTNGEIKLVVKALCYALGDSERHYNVKVDDKGIVIEYRTAEAVDSNPDPQTAKETEYELGHYELELNVNLFELTDAVILAVEEIETKEIEFKRM
jgi:hypothetical protein